MAVITSEVQLLMFVLPIVAVNCASTGNKTELETHSSYEEAALETLSSYEKAALRIPLIDLLRGRDGRDGLPGRDGKDGEPGPQGQQGPPGPQGLQGLQGLGSAGVTYIRWGKSSCHNTSGTQLVYAGRAGGTFYSTQGGGADKLCLPLNPDYISNSRSTSTSHVSPIYGVEYETHNGPLHNLYEHNAPCAVCYASTRAAMIMVPAKTECPSSWTREYYGYLMTEHPGHRRSSFDCVDVNPDTVPGGTGSVDGALFYHVTATCTGLQCPPYVANKVLSCAVCTK